MISKKFKKFIFSLDLLLTQPIEREGTAMPSPNQLKRKFIIKVFIQ
jgi:hypothetical protein